MAAADAPTGGLAGAAASGDRRATLEALRDVLAASIGEVAADKRAPLAKQLAEVMRELGSIEQPKGSKVDDLAARRAARRSSASGM